MKRSFALSTLCAHSREERPAGPPPLTAPIYQSAVWALDSAEQCDAIYEKEEAGFIYTRDANPNHAALERLVAALEGAEDALAVASGMGAVAVALLELVQSGDHVIASDTLYGATTRLLEKELSRFGVSSTFVPAHDLQRVRAAFQPATRAVFVETLTNPLTSLADVPALAALCRERGARLVVDATFTPTLSRTLEQGADVVLHSLTKFIGGHSDLTLGAVAGSRELVAGMRVRASNWGLPANPFEAWLALRGAATLPLRIQRSCENAARVAAFLAAHPAVRAVHYPGLPSHPQHARAAELLSGGGAMLSFELSNGDAARRCLRALRLVPFAPSLGDASTTISYPAATSHRSLTAERRAELGIADGLLRLSVGIDEPEDVTADLEQAIGV